MSRVKSLALQSWLEDAGSFIERLRKNGIHPGVVVLRQAWCMPTAGERQALRVAARRSIFVREVEIRDEEGPLMFARAAIPTATLTGRERCLAQLRTRSLGSVLFAYPQFERSAFEIKRCQVLAYSTEPLWERQSLFSLKGKSLLLREVFLPRLIHFIDSL